MPATDATREKKALLQSIWEWKHGYRDLDPAVRTAWIRVLTVRYRQARRAQHPEAIDRSMRC